MKPLLSLLKGASVTFAHLSGEPANEARQLSFSPEHLVRGAQTRIFSEPVVK
jgi:hypothetical protein